MKTYTTRLDIRGNKTANITVSDESIEVIEIEFKKYQKASEGEETNSTMFPYRYLKDFCKANNIKFEIT